MIGRGAETREAERCWTPDQVAAMCRGISAILACPDLATAARETLSSCRELIGARIASVALFADDGASSTLSHLDAAGNARLLPPARARRLAGLRALAGSIGRGRIENGQPRIAGLPFPGRTGTTLQNLLVVPMTIGGAALGLLCLADKPGGFAEHDLRLAFSFGEIAGAAHQRCQVADSLGRSERQLRRSAARLESSKRSLELRVARATRELRLTNATLRRKIAAFEKIKRSLEIERGFRNSVEDSLLTGIVVVDRQSRVLHVNRAFCRMVGWTRRELVGRTPPFPFWPPEREAERLAAFRKLQRGSLANIAVKARYTRRSGELFDVLVMCAPLRGPRGRTAGLVASVGDITRQVRTESALRETAAQLRQISARLLSVQERERKRISRELHDGLGQTLSALKYRLEEAVLLCAAGRPGREMRQRLVGAAQVLGGAIGDIRAIVMDLRPSALDDLGLVSAIRGLCREHERTHPGTRVAVRMVAGERDVPEDLKIILFRLLQEALNNIAKHSGADRVVVGIAVAARKLELAVRDNGRGFARPLTRAGVGLPSMRERTELSGGVLTVTSRPGKGTTVRAVWPLPAPHRSGPSRSAPSSRRTP